MDQVSLSETLYAFIGAHVWWLTAVMYILLALGQSFLGGGRSTRRPKAKVVPAPPAEAQ